MFKKKHATILLSAAVTAVSMLSLPVCAQTTPNPSTVNTDNAAGKNTQPNKDTGSNTKDTHQQMQTDTSGSSGATAMGTADLNFIRELANANIAEIDTAKIAQEKSKNQKVLGFSKQMMDDHTGALEKVKQLAQTKGITLPAEPDDAHKAAAKKLSALSGKAFDRSYMAQAGVSDHKKTVSLLKKINSEAKDADLKALTTEMLPTVEQHLQMAQKK